MGRGKLSLSFHLCTYASILWKIAKSVVQGVCPDVYPSVIERNAECVNLVYYLKGEMDFSVVCIGTCCVVGGSLQFRTKHDFNLKSHEFKVTI